MENFYLISFTSNSVGESGEAFNTKYFLTSDSCDKCGTNAVLEGYLKTKGLRSESSHDLFVTINLDFIISRALVHTLKKRLSFNDDFKPICDFSTRQELPFFSIFPEVFFPKMQSDSGGIQTERQCISCQRDGYFDVLDFDSLSKGQGNHIPRKYVYLRKQIETLPKSGFYRTWEHFGNSNLVKTKYKTIRYARPSIIVTNSIKEIFHELGVKDILYEEIFLE